MDTCIKACKQTIETGILKSTEDDYVAPNDDHVGHQVGHNDQDPDQGHVSVGAAHVVNSAGHQVSLTTNIRQ